MLQARLLFEEDLDFGFIANVQNREKAPQEFNFVRVAEFPVACDKDFHGQFGDSQSQLAHLVHFHLTHFLFIHIQNCLFGGLIVAESDGSSSVVRPPGNFSFGEVVKPEPHNQSRALLQNLHFEVVSAGSIIDVVHLFLVSGLV